MAVGAGQSCGGQCLPPFREAVCLPPGLGAFSWVPGSPGAGTWHLGNVPTHPQGLFLPRGELWQRLQQAHICSELIFSRGLWRTGEWGGGVTCQAPSGEVRFTLLILESDLSALSPSLISGIVPGCCGIPPTHTPAACSPLACLFLSLCTQAHPEMPSLHSMVPGAVGQDWAQVQFFGGYLLS